MLFIAAPVFAMRVELGVADTEILRVAGSLPVVASYVSCPQHLSRPSLGTIMWMHGVVALAWELGAKKTKKTKPSGFFHTSCLGLNSVPVLGIADPHALIISTLSASMRRRSPSTSGVPSLFAYAAVSMSTSW